MKIQQDVLYRINQQGYLCLCKELPHTCIEGGIEEEVYHPFSTLINHSGRIVWPEDAEL